MTERLSDDLLAEIEQHHAKGYVNIASDGMPYIDAKQEHADMRDLLSDLRACHVARDEAIRHLNAVLDHTDCPCHSVGCVVTLAKAWAFLDGLRAGRTEVST